MAKVKLHDKVCTGTPTPATRPMYATRLVRVEGLLVPVEYRLVLVRFWVVRGLWPEWFLIPVKINLIDAGITVTNYNSSCYL